jgi:hypothetical protein
VPRLARVLALSAAALGAAALVVVPGSGAGSATSCLAWASLPARVTLGARPVVVHTTLRGTAGCRPVTADAGSSGVLNGPGPSTQDFPLRWDSLGATDTATFYLSLSRPGTYRISDGDLQVYDARYIRIPSQWRSTSTAVKYAGRFAGVARRGATVHATLQYQTAYGWRAHTHVLVALQRRDAGAWHTVARTRSSSSGAVNLRASSGSYRLVSAATGVVWGSTLGLGSSRA